MKKKKIKEIKSLLKNAQKEQVEEFYYYLVEHMKGDRHMKQLIITLINKCNDKELLKLILELLKR